MPVIEKRYRHQSQQRPKPRPRPREQCDAGGPPDPDGESATARHGAVVQRARIGVGVRQAPASSKPGQRERGHR
ncbi:MAG TPA: hypothetical protein VJQ49_04950, partial [Casimicrobiaceae bacterium]|nr:hypothetical protein [Casimicrobiaceae bacterium]